MSFLHHAAAVGHCTTARALLDANMDVNVKDKYTLTHCLSCNEPDCRIVPLSLSCAAFCPLCVSCIACTAFVAAAEPFLFAADLGDLPCIFLAVW